jgi:hypothetical protein
VFKLLAVPVPEIRLMAVIMIHSSDGESLPSES